MNEVPSPLGDAPGDERGCCAPAWPDGVADLLAAAADLLTCTHVRLIAIRGGEPRCLALDGDRTESRQPSGWERVAFELIRNAPLVVADVGRATDASAGLFAAAGFGAVVAAPLVSISGEPSGLLCVAHDGPHPWTRLEVQAIVGYAATASRCFDAESDRRLADAQHWFRSVFDRAPLGMSVTETLTRRIVDANPQFAEICGRTVDELVGMDWIDLTHPDDVEEDLAGSAAVASGDVGLFRVPKRYVRPDGSIVWIEMSIAPLDAVDVTTPMHLCMIDDISERRLRDLELEQLGEVLESSPDYVLTADGSGRILWCNIAGRALFGVATVEELQATPQSFLPHLSENSRQRYTEEALPELWSSGMWIGEVEALLADGSALPLSLSVIAHFGADGYPEHFSIVGRDISAAKSAAHALSVSEARMRTLVDAAPIGIFETNPFGFCTYVNPSFCTITGLADPEDALGFGWGNVVHPDDAVAVGTAWAVAIHTDQRFVQQFRFVASDGSVVWADVEAIPVHDEHGRTTMFLGTIDDITERLELERARFESAELFRTAFEHAPTGMVLTDVSTDEPVLVQCNDEYGRILGRSVDEIRGMNLLQLTHPEDVDGVAEGRRALIRGEIDHHHTEVRTLRPDGTWIWTSLTRSLVRDADGRPKYSLSQVSDITEQKEIQQQIERLAFADALTGLPNRRAFVEALDRAVATRQSAGRPVALLFVDLDHFKTVNDRLGHDAGDELLIAVAGGLTSAVRTTDVVARLGGDEFAVIITDVAVAEMERIAQRLGETMRFPRELPDGTVVTVTASIGMAWAAGDESVDEFLRRADEAMYEAKHLGRDQLVVHRG